MQLKILQTALTLMQSPLLAEDEVRIDPAYTVQTRDFGAILPDVIVFGQDAVAAVLGICFRLFADPKNPDSVVNTAATTVRQACPFLRVISPQPI